MINWILACALSAAPPLEVGMRLHGRYLLEEGRVPDNAFEINRARLALEVAPTEWLFAELDIDASEPGAMLRDAYLEITPRQWLTITVGQFKKPFSRLELINPGALPLWRRGLSNDVIVEDLGFGDRDLGIMTKFRAGGMRLSLGVFNGSGIQGEQDSGKAAAARITYRLLKQVRIGASASMQYRNEPRSRTGGKPRHDVWAAGVDGRFRHAGFDLVGEVLWAQGPDTRRGPDHLGAMLYTFYRVPLTDDLQLVPLAKFEILDEELRRYAPERMSITAGVNLHIGELLRVFLQGEQIIWQVQDRQDERRLVLQLAFDHKIELGTPAPEETP